MALPITTLYSIGLSLIMLILWMNVTRTRASLHISIGSADSAVLHERVRRHGNFMEWVPITLILLALAEIQAVAPTWLHAGGLLAVLGRLTHPFGLLADNPSHPLRIIGNLGNLLATVILIIALVRVLLT